MVFHFDPHPDLQNPHEIPHFPIKSTIDGPFSNQLDAENLGDLPKKNYF
jgi:hypothetical protein